MSGIATQFVLLDLVRNRLANSGDPAQTAISDALSAQSAYAYLGAVGPAVVDFMPNNLQPGGLGGASGLSPFAAFWVIVYGIAEGTQGVPGLFPTLTKLNSFLNQVDTIAANQDLGALEDLKNNGGLTAGLNAMGDLSTIVGNISNVVVPLITNITTTENPVVNVPVGQAVPPPIAWDCRDFMHWKRTGDFADALVASAQASGDARFLAYAYGYVIAYTAKVCGSPFVNSIVGSTYRLNWWRNRWINMYGDAWVWGFYNTNPQPTFSGDTPTPSYDSWSNLCSANLQSKIELSGIDPSALLGIVTSSPNSPQTFPTVLPADFSDFWFKAFEQAYGTPPAGSRFTSDGLNGAYLLTWLMLWFQTSGQVLGCNSAPPMAPPSGNCGSNPPWVDPTSSPPGSNGTPNLPPSPSIEQDPDVGEIVCGAILALLGLAALFTGGAVAGGAGIAGGVDLIISGASQINWDNLRCQLYWYHLYIYNGLNALHQAAELVGIVHPYASELATDSTTLNLLGLSFGPFDSGERIVKSRAVREDFPAGLWNPAPPNWIAAPGTAVEEPITIAYLTAAYPNFWIDDAADNPLSNGQVRVAGAWPVDLAGGKVPVQFGNAVDNSIDALLKGVGSLPNWNLDADRGLAYMTWQFQGNYASPVQIEPE